MAKVPPENQKLPQVEIKVGFDKETVDIPIDQLAAVKVIQPATLKSTKFQQILAAIREVGIIEPPVVCRNKQSGKKYILLDGHLRLAALKELGETQVTCLISTDDEAFTYNKHVNRLSPVQEHKMILRAIERGVSAEKIANALNTYVNSIIRKRNLLTVICKAAAYKMVAADVFFAFRQMLPMRLMFFLNVM